MKASVIIPNLNGESWIGQSIESCLEQTFKDFELIVIDNGSTDRSIEIIEAYGADRQNYSVIKFNENTGFSAAVNAGIRAAKGEYAVLFNNDAFAEPTWLEALVQCADEDESIFSVSSLMIRHFERELADDAGDYMTIIGWACKRGDGLLEKRYNKRMRVFSACGGAALYRKSILDEIGLFDENFFAYLEDVDIGWRANAMGYKNIFCPTARCYHICSATTGGKYNDFKSIQSGRNNLLLPYKNMPIIQLVLNLPFLFAGFFVKTVFFYIRGYGKPFVKGIGEAFGMFGRIEKPKFKFKNLPNYLLIQGWIFIDTFTYIDYRIKRYLKIK